jgi:hypothetical protein
MAFLILAAAGVFGSPVIDALSAGGYQDPSSESSQAQRVLAEKFGYGDQEMIVTVTSEAGVQSEAARTVATGIVAQLKASRTLAGWTRRGPCRRRSRRA